MTEEVEKLIFQFLMELDEENESKGKILEEEKNFLKKLEETEKQYEIPKAMITELIELLVILKSEIKYIYFKYGITAERTARI